MSKSNQLVPKKLTPNKLIPRYVAGFAALFTVVVISAAVLIMAYGASMLGLGALDLGYTARRGGEALAATDGCVEETMRRLRMDANYGSGGIDLLLGSISCKIDVTNPDLPFDSGQRLVTVLGRSGDYYKKIQTQLIVASQFVGSLNTVTVNSWEERSN